MRVPKVWLWLILLILAGMIDVIRLPAASPLSQTEEAAATRVRLEIGRPLNLASYGGPHVQLTIMGIDADSISVKTLDFDHLTKAVVNNVVTSQPTLKFFSARRTIGFSGVKSLLLTTEHLSVYFVDDMNTRQNHVLLEILRH
jgi:hypothetical protein